jgi:AcrR family transcriptional regulator
VPSRRCCFYLDTAVSLLVRDPRPGYPFSVASLPDHLLPGAVGKEPIAKAVLEQHQRRRVLAGATGVFVRCGYRSTTVDQIVSAANIGVGTFYGLFQGKEDCFLCLYDLIVAEAEEAVGVAVAGEGRWEDRVVEALRALLELAAAEPDRARIAIVEAPTAGPAAQSRYAETVARLAAALGESRSGYAPCGGPPAGFEHAAVAGLAWTLHQRLAVGEPLVVADLLPEMADFVVAPYAGTGMFGR